MKPCGYKAGLYEKVSEFGIEAGLVDGDPSVEIPIGTRNTLSGLRPATVFLSVTYLTGLLCGQGGREGGPGDSTFSGLEERWGVVEARKAGEDEKRPGSLWWDCF